MQFLAKNLQFLRKKSGYTQAELTKHIEVTRTTWGNYENSVSEPDLTTLYEIAKFFGVTMDHLLCSDLTDDVNLNNYFNQAYREQQILNSENHSNKFIQQNPDTNKGNIDNEILSKLNELAENMEILKKGLL